MREKDNDQFWLLINWMDDVDNELTSIKRKVENSLTDIRHKRSRLMDYLLEDDNEVIEDEVKRMGSNITRNMDCD